MAFTKETARKAGQKSKRGKAKLNLTTRQFILSVLEANRERFDKELNNLSPKEFIDVYLKLMPFILAPRSKQEFEVSDLDHNELKELISQLVNEA